ncbi:MAG: trypsin-like peptidase domain-containing protein [Cyclobacteriaceae bacterium]|nr:trypsin-like peptidase domain-containing protein [Cyclobacteriaceae bacterium]
MFDKAYKTVQEFTFPLIIIARFYDKRVVAEVGNFILLNKDGWLMTTAYHFRYISLYKKHKSEIEEYQIKSKSLYSRKRKSKRQQKKLLKLQISKDWITHYDILFGGINMGIKEYYVFSEHDLALVRVDPKYFDRVEIYPSIRGSSSLKPGIKLCRIGYVCTELNISFDESTNKFSINELPRLSRLPIDGIYTRNVIAGKSRDGNEIVYIETSTSGLAGHEGCAIVDEDGNICAIHSSNLEVSVGLIGIHDKKQKLGNSHLTGIGVHSKTITKLLSSCGIDFKLTGETEPLESEIFTPDESGKVKMTLKVDNEDPKESSENKFLIGSFKSVFIDFGLCLCAFKNSEYIPSGTAVMVGPCLAMTARHVVEDFLRVFDGKKYFEGNPKKDTGTFSTMVINPKSEAKWAVQQFYFLVEGVDVAFLKLAPQNQMAKDRVNIFATIDLSMPKIGDKIFAFGFVDTQTIAEKKSEDHISFGNGMSRSLAYSEGVVKEVHQQYRDLSRLKFPCFQTNARFDGGMSGGPVLNENGIVIGLVCSNLPPSSIEEEHVSYVSLLWSSMLISISLPFPEFELDKDYPVLFLAKHKIINVIGWEKCFLEKNDSGKFVIGFRLD